MHTFRDFPLFFGIGPMCYTTGSFLKIHYYSCLLEQLHCRTLPHHLSSPLLSDGQAKKKISSWWISYIPERRCGVTQVDDASWTLHLKLIHSIWSGVFVLCIFPVECFFFLEKFRDTNYHVMMMRERKGRTMDAWLYACSRLSLSRVFVAEAHATLEKKRNRRDRELSLPAWSTFLPL